MGITTKLAQDLFNIQTLSSKDIEQLHTLIIDFFAAAYAGYKLNREFNISVEKVIYENSGGVQVKALFYFKIKNILFVQQLL